MTKHYQQAIEYMAEEQDWKRLAKRFAQHHPASFCRAVQETREDYVAQCAALVRSKAPGSKVEAIKLWRTNTGDSPKQAKEAVERLV